MIVYHFDYSCWFNYNVVSILSNFLSTYQKLCNYQKYENILYKGECSSLSDIYQTCAKMNERCVSLRSDFLTHVDFRTYHIQS